MVERERQVPNAKDPETPSSDDRQHNRQGALLAQQTMDEDDTATQETVPSKHVGRMQQIIREGMALLSSSSDFASPDMIALIEKAHTLWAELGEKEATAQVLALQGTMAEGEVASPRSSRTFAVRCPALTHALPATRRLCFSRWWTWLFTSGL